MNQQILSFQDIVNLYKAGKVNDAYNNLNNYLVYNSQDSKPINLLSQIKEDILKSNLKKIDEAIERVEWLWKEKKYNELLNAYLEIKKFAPDYEKLEQLIKKAYNAYTKQLENQNEEQFLRIKQIVTTNLQNKEYKQAIEFLEKTIASSKDPDPAYKQLVIDVKRTIIDEKLKTNAKYLKSSEIPKVYEFLKNLYDFEPSFPKIQKMLIEQHKKLDQYYKNKKFVFEKDSERQIKILFNTKEFEKCIQTCDELLRTTFFNKTAIKYRAKAEKGLIDENFKTAYQKIKVEA